MLGLVSQRSATEGFGRWKEELSVVLNDIGESRGVVGEALCVEGEVVESLARGGGSASVEEHVGYSMGEGGVLLYQLGVLEREVLLESREWEIERGSGVSLASVERERELLEFCRACVSNVLHSDGGEGYEASPSACAYSTV